MKSVLYLGDGPVTGPACYLSGILKYAGFSATHLWNQKLSPKVLKKKFSVIILSDYSSRNISKTCSFQIQEQVLDGCGLLMIGGWSSFRGRDGHYENTLIEEMLPVKCLSRDDRHNLASGAFLLKRKSAADILRGILMKPAPFIVGYNEVRMKKNAELILELKENASGRTRPLLVTGRYGRARTAAFMTDAAPHWCGGLVDWGSERVRIQVASGVQIEVGSLYVKFFVQLLRSIAKTV